MQIFLNNMDWMEFNIFLAALGVAAGFLFVSFKHRVLKVISFIIWLLFIPNTIYLVTDLQYLPDQLTKVEGTIQILLLLQYLVLVILGVSTYISALRPMEKTLAKSRFWKSKVLIFIVLLNFLISFGVVLGKMMRVYSWYVLTDPLRVIQGSREILTSVNLIIFFILFGLLTNIIYVSFRKRLSKSFAK